MRQWLTLSTLRDEARTRLWPRPVLALVVAVALGTGLPQLDSAVQGRIPDAVTAYLFSGGAGAARTVLNVIATAMITVTSLTFSLTVVTLQLASSQFSPRLLRTFTRDRFVHSTLAMFLGSFVYALTVLRTVRSPEEEARGAFVPQFSVTFAFVLAVGSAVVLILFLAHLAREIRVETILRNVHDDASGTIQRVLPARPEARPPRPHVPGPADPRLLLAPASGFLVGVHAERLHEAVLAADAVVVVDKAVGDSFVEGTPVARAWSLSPDARLSDESLRTLQDGLSRAVETGFERTSRQDVAFGLRQLTDVGVKALSPGINDPTTAVHALSHSAVLLCDLLRRDLEPHVLDDDAGRARLVLSQRPFAELLELAVAQPRIYGADDPYVLRALLSLLHAAAWIAERPEEIAAIEAQLARTRHTISHGSMDTVHKHELSDLAEEVADAIIGGVGRDGPARTTDRRSR